MKKVSKVVQRIENHYVGDSCVQVMAPYKKALTILDDMGIMFHSKEGSDLYINKYLDDERRFQFPYSNIPTHYSKCGLFGSICYTNQLFDFEKPYIRICDNSIIESYAIKDSENNDAIMINSIMNFYKRTGYRTRKELAKLFEKSDENEDIYFISLSGGIQQKEPNVDEFIPTEEKICTVIKERLQKNVDDFRKYQSDMNGNDTVSRYLYDNPYFLDFAEQSIGQFDLSKYELDAPLGDIESTIIVRIKDGNISMQNIQVNFVGINNYRVTIYDIPINKYTLEQLKFVSKINITKEPKIPLKLNPSITKKDIEEAKQKVRSLRK